MDLLFILGKWLMAAGVIGFGLLMVALGIFLAAYIEYRWQLRQMQKEYDRKHQARPQR